MMHLPNDVARKLFGITMSNPFVVSMSLLIDERTFMGFTLMPNYHELPNNLECEFLFGHLMVVFTIDGCKVLDASESLYVNSPFRDL